MQKAYEDLNQINPDLLSKYCDEGFKSLKVEEINNLTQLLERNSGWYMNYGAGKYRFKNSAFKEESEKRVFIVGRKGKAEPFYRKKGNTLIPYLKLIFDEKLIEGITIGPCENQNIARLGLTHFISSNSKLIIDDMDEFITESPIPYRV